MTDDIPETTIYVTDDEREALAAHRWYPTHWGDGRGGYNWKCSCGVNDWGTGKENPERYHRYETSELAALAAVEHIAAGFRRQGPITDEWVASVARALYVAQMAGADAEPDWENETGYIHDAFMADARAALEAARDAS